MADGDGDGGACVYVTQALLDALERDKRSLKWQLARATSDAAEHAAQRAACEAKVKDLMTIVEMNKSVAHKAMERNYRKESVLQRLHQERVQLQTCVETQRRRGVASLERRIHQKHLHEMFQLWANKTMVRVQRRLAIRRMLRSLQRRSLQHGFTRWRRVIGGSKPLVTTAAPVYPISPSNYIINTVPEKISQVRFVLSPTSSIRSESSVSIVDHSEGSRTKSLSFATWKAQWLAQKRRHTTATHFSRLMLGKRVLLAWKHVLRRRNWRDAMIASAMRRRRYHCFEVWASWTKRRQRARLLFSKLFKRTVRRTLRDVFMKMRIRCLEKCMADWTDVLKEARRAMDEERKVYSLHQSELMREIEKKAADQESQQALLVDTQLKAMMKKQRLAVLMKYVAKWQRTVALGKMHVRIADQYAFGHQRRRLVRQVLLAWKIRSQQARAVKRFQQRRISWEAKVQLSLSFRAFASTTKRLAAQKRALFQIVYRRRVLTSSRAFWRWRGVIALADAHAHAHLEQRQLANRLDIREIASNAEAKRLRRICYQYQLRCALALGDGLRERHKRRVFAAWKVIAVRMRKRKAALRKVVTKKSRMVLLLATLRWRDVCELQQTFELTMQERARGRKKKTMKTVFNAWRAASHKEIVSSARGGLQFITLLLWKKRSDQQRARNAGLRLILKFHARFRWKKPAFERWRRRVEVATAVATRHQQRTQELVRRTFLKWTVWFARRSRRRTTQSEAITVRAEGKATHRLLVTTWIAWRDQVAHYKAVEKVTSLSHSLLSKSERARTLRRLWQTWVQETKSHKARQVLLRRVLDRRSTNAVSEAWRLWLLATARENGVRTGRALHQRKLQRTLRVHHKERGLRSILRNWRQLTQALKQRRLSAHRRMKQRQLASLTRFFTHWQSSFVSLMQYRRMFLRAILLRRRNALLRIGLQKWSLETQQVTALHDLQHSSAHRSKLQSKALVFLRRVWATRGLRAYFVAWQKFLQQNQKLKQVLRRLTKRKATLSTLFAWNRWIKYARSGGILQRAIRISTIHILRCAWYQLQTSTRYARAQERVLQRLHDVLAIVMLRWTWSQWKRKDHALLVFRATSSQTASSSLLQAFMNRVGRRHFAKSLLGRVFCNWKAHAHHQRSLRQRVVSLLMKQDSLSVRRCFQSWAFDVAKTQNSRRLLLKILMRRTLAQQRSAFTRWRTFVTEIIYTTKLAASQRRLEAHRDAVARRVAMTLFASWQRPSLGAVFHGWKGVLNDQNRMVKQLLLRQINRRLKVVWSAWQQAIVRLRALQEAIASLAHRKQLRAIALAWQLWLERMQWMCDVNTAIQRMDRRVQLRLLRRGWQSLRLHQDMEMRRQSMMVVLSAQQQLNQQKELHRLRNIALILQRHRKGRLREPFLRWKDFVSTKRECKAMLLAVTKRYNRRTARIVLRAWRCAVLKRLSQKRRISKWRNTHCRRRSLRLVWHMWTLFVERRDVARQVLVNLSERGADQILRAAWTTWRSVVEEEIEAEAANELAHWRRATTMQQNQVTSLEAKTELLILESVELKRAMQSQRQRCAEAFARRISRVLESAWRRKLKATWTHWARMTETLATARWIVQRLVTHKEREAFVRWKREVQHQKWTAHETMMLDRVAQILGASTVASRKKKSWRQWTTYVKQRRAKRVQQRVIEMLQRKQGDNTMVRVVFAGWKTAVQNQTLRRGVALIMGNAVNHQLLRRVLTAWSKRRECIRSKREATIMLCRIDRSIERRSVQLGWLKWRNYMAESAVVLAKSHVVLMEVEASERDASHVDETYLTRVWTAWREVTTQRRLRRERLCIQQVHFDTLRTKQQAMHAWHKFVHDANVKMARRQQPMLCVRTNVKKRCKSIHDSKPVCEHSVVSYAQYHRYRVHWRVQLSRRITHTRLRRVYGLAWLLHFLRRQHLRIQRRALWRWFAAIQPISCALQAVSFFELPWRRPDVDYAGSMLLLTLEELDLTQQTHRSEKLQCAWRGVDAIARSIRRQGVRRAFDKWRWNRAKLPASARGGAASRRLVEDTGASDRDRIRARALVVQLTRVQVRRAFSTWKAEYVALAMERAQADYDALQAALARRVMERRAMGTHV